jgi:hypothetical protein
MKIDKKKRKGIGELIYCKLRTREIRSATDT